MSNTSASDANNTRNSSIILLFSTWNMKTDTELIFLCFTEIKPEIEFISLTLFSECLNVINMLLNNEKFYSRKVLNKFEWNTKIFFFLYPENNPLKCKISCFHTSNLICKSKQFAYFYLFVECKHFNNSKSLKSDLHDNKIEYKTMSLPKWKKSFLKAPKLEIACKIKSW